MKRYFKNMNKSVLFFVGIMLGAVLMLPAAYVFGQVVNNVIHGCVSINKGDLRVLDPNESCDSSKETALDWNIQGVPGPSGPPGPTGVPGSAGSSSKLICTSIQGYVPTECVYSFVHADAWKNGDYSGSILENARLGDNETNTQGPVMTNSNFDNSFFKGTNINSANLSGSSFKNAIVDNGAFRASNFTNVDFTGSTISLLFTNLILVGSNFSEVVTTGTTFESVDLTNATFTDASFTNTGFEFSDLTGATGLDTATLTNVTWVDTICPDGTNSTANGNTCVGHLTP